MTILEHVEVTMVQIERRNVCPYVVRSGSSVKKTTCSVSSAKSEDTHRLPPPDICPLRAYPYLLTVAAK